MNEITTLSAISSEIAKQKMAIALTKVSLSAQKLQDEADSLVFNEDNVEKIKEFINKVKKVENAIKAEHEVLKKPYLDGGKACDTAKNELLTLIGSTKERALHNYAALCNAIDGRNRESERIKAEKEAILKGIAGNLMEFSGKIAACTTKEELVSVERLINLEKSSSRVSKYGNFHQQAIDQYNEILIPILKKQKLKIDEFEALNERLNKTDDAQEFEQINELISKKGNEILQNQVDVQQAVINQTPAPVFEPEILTANVSARRTEVVCEIVDIEAVFKHSRQLLNIELKTKEAKKEGAELRDTGVIDIGKDIILGGIRYSLKKLW